MTVDEVDTTQADEESPDLRRLRDAIDAIQKYDIGLDLVRASELGSELNFGSARALFERIQKFASQLKGMPWVTLVDRQIAPTSSSMAQVADILRQISEFRSTQPEALRSRDELIETLTRHFEATMEAATPLVGALTWQSIDLEQVRTEVAKVLEDVRLSSRNALSEIEQRKQEADQNLAAIREASLTAGVAHHADVFKAAAERHELSAANWLKLAGGLAILTLLAAFVIVFLWDTKGDTSDVSALQLVAVKALIVFLGVYSVFTAIKIFRAQSHLAVVNRHREDALRTYRAFAEGTESETVRDQVLLGATQAIFGLTTTGLIDDKEAIDPSLLVRILGR
ncbi:MAG: hypothetical protein AB7T32_16135 [Dehalococcoidia bacterium]